MRIRGNVLPPTFHFDADVIDFGLVSFGFLSSRFLTFQNDSDVCANGWGGGVGSLTVYGWWSPACVLTRP